MEKDFTKYKLKRIAVEALKNALRLHLDAIMLYEYGSYPSAVQMSVQALEEFSKAQRVDQYFSSMMKGDLPEANFEESWLQMLYLQPEQSLPFIDRKLSGHTLKSGSFLEDRHLELKKRQASYVGLNGKKDEAEGHSRVSVPSKIKEVDARKLITLVNRQILKVHALAQNDEGCWGIEEMNGVINSDDHLLAFCWPHKA